MSEHLMQDYERRCGNGSDIHMHLPALCALARECASERPAMLAEFGTRGGESTTAFLAGLAESNFGGTLHSYDIAPTSFAPAGELPANVIWKFHQSDTSALGYFPHVDLLFIDTLHTAAQVTAELAHAPRVKSLLAFHDTVLFGSVDEGTGAAIGINHAIYEWMATPEGRKWQVRSHDWRNNGLLVLERR